MLTSDIHQFLKEARFNCDIAYGYLAGNGAIAELEAKLCTYYGARHALCVDSATNGLMYLLLAASLKRSEILTSSLSYGGTIAGALALDCKLHFADIDSSLNISPRSTSAILAKNRKIKAVLAVDFAGNPHQMEAIHDMCEEHGIWHFVDAAQAFGATIGTTYNASLCDAIVLSFGSGKTIYGGEGGAIITNNTSLYNKLVSICQHAHRQERDLGIGLSHEFALNGRINPLAAIVINESFNDGLIALDEKRNEYTRTLEILSVFKSVSEILCNKTGTFYHVPFSVSDIQLFEKEFNSSSLLRDKFYFTKADFQTLPKKLEHMNYRSRIKESSCSTAEEILNNLYLLHLYK